jgi:hypothetical protein
VQAVAVGELEMEFAVVADIFGLESDLFAGFADGAFMGLLAGLEATAGAVDFSRAEAAFFSDQEDLAVADQEAERRSLSGLPIIPEGIHQGRRPMRSRG